jgi:hypothetical protein
MHVRSFNAMTETTASQPSFRLTRTAGTTRRSTSDHPRAPRVRLTLPAWLPRSILQRGGVATRDDVRALRDLEAARDRSDW